jgi:hypothetical protein
MHDGAYHKTTKPSSHVAEEVQYKSAEVFAIFYLIKAPSKSCHVFLYLVLGYTRDDSYIALILSHKSLHTRLYSPSFVTPLLPAAMTRRACIHDLTVLVAPKIFESQGG